MFKKNQIIEITNYNSMFNQQIPKDVPLYFHSYEKDDNNETYYITPKPQGGFYSHTH